MCLLKAFRCYSDYFDPEVFNVLSIVQRLNGKYFIYFYLEGGGVDVDMVMQFNGIHSFQMKCYLNLCYQ